jgi:hypothetical protein
MDILSHILWTGLASRVLRRKINKQLDIKQAIFWGIFPDLFAFLPLLIWLFFSKDWHIFEIYSFDGHEPSLRNDLPIFYLIILLYSLGHSLIIFIFFVGILYLVLYLLNKRIYLEIFGWLLHILIDLLTHSYKHFPTPVFWPLFGWRFDGLDWKTPWFLILNYSILAVIYFLIYQKVRGTKRGLSFR